MLEGELVLRTDAGEQTLTPAPAPASRPAPAMATSCVNRGKVPAVYLEISNRDPADAVVYPDVDLLWNPPGQPHKYTRRDGTPY